MDFSLLLTGDNHLHVAARRKVILERHTLLSDYVLNSANLAGETPLIVAVKERSLPTIRCFTRMPYLNINQQDFEGNTALHHAIKQHDITFFSTLCANGACPAILNREGQSSIHLAAEQKDPAIMRGLFLKSPAAFENVNLLNEDGDTPLHTAVKAENGQVISFLIKKRANLREQDANGNLLLHWAIKIGSRQLTKQLLNATVVNHVNGDGYTPIQLAVQRGHGQIVDLLRQAGADLACRDPEDNTLLHLACFPQGTNVLSFLLLQNNSPLRREARNTDGRTPLQLAASLGQLEAVQRLIAADATLATTDFLAQTPLMTAITYGHSNIAEYILSLLTGSNVSMQTNHRDYFGNTALHLCATADNVHVARLLMEKGASVMVKNNIGHTPISIIEVSREKTDSEVYMTLFQHLDPERDFLADVAGPSFKTNPAAIL